MSGDQAAIVLIFVFAILGPCMIIAATGWASISALGRNPSAPKIFTAMIMMVIFGTAISVVSLLVLFQVYVPSK